MTALPHPAQEPVDRRSASAAHQPPAAETDHDPSYGLPPVADVWFTPVRKRVRGGEQQVTAWRFTCPFCGEERKEDDYREAYGWAYSHLRRCEWIMDPLWAGDEISPF